MKVTHCSLVLALVFACGSYAQGTFDLPPKPSNDALEAQLDGLGMGDAVASSVRHYLGEWPEGAGYGFHFTGEERGDVNEVQVVRFASPEGAQRYVVQEEILTVGDYMAEVRGPYLVMVSGLASSDPERALEVLRDVWSAVARVEDTHSIPPTSMRTSRVHDGVVYESDSSDPDFLALYQGAANADSPFLNTHEEDGVRRIVIGKSEGLKAHAQASRLTASDRSALRERGDEGNGGRTRGLQLGGPKKATPGLVKTLQPKG